MYIQIWKRVYASVYLNVKNNWINIGDQILKIKRDKTTILAVTIIAEIAIEFHHQTLSPNLTSSGGDTSISARSKHILNKNKDNECSNRAISWSSEILM